MADIMIGGESFNTSCPAECPGKSESFSQGGLCHRCPIFNCAGEFKLLEPSDYRDDWAKAWRRWFDSGMNGFPELLLRRSVT